MPPSLKSVIITPTQVCENARLNKTLGCRQELCQGLGDLIFVEIPQPRLLLESRDVAVDQRISRGDTDAVVNEISGRGAMRANVGYFHGHLHWLRRHPFYRNNSVAIYIRFGQNQPIRVVLRSLLHGSGSSAVADVEW